MSTREQVKEWIMHMLEEKEQTQAQLLKRMEDDHEQNPQAMFVAKGTFIEAKRELISEKRIEEKHIEAKRGAPPNLLVFTKEEKARRLRKFKKAEKRRILKDQKITIVPCYELKDLMDFSKQANPQLALDNIAQTLLTITDVLWQVTGFPEEEGRVSNVEEHLAALREISRLVEPYSGCPIPVPIDFQPSENITNFAEIPGWIRSLREAKNKK